MIDIKEYVAPDSLEEAYDLLTAKRNNIIIGGCGFLKMGKKTVGTAIDLCNLDLDYIKEDQEKISIGADTSLRSLEISPIIRDYCGGLLSEGVSNIVGVQFRNMAKIGASVFSRYGFSDSIPSLLVLDAKVVLYNGGTMDLKDFLDKEYEKDILVEIILPKKEGIGVSDCLRKSSIDFPIINGAMFKGKDGSYEIAIGSRPQRGKLAEKSGKALGEGKDIGKVAEMVIEELHIGGNIRGSKEYREDMCKVLTKRMYEKIGEYDDR